MALGTQRLAHSALWLVHQCAPLLYPPLRCVSLDSISAALSLSLHIDNVVQADWEDVSERDPMLGRSLQVDGPQSKMVQ